MAIASRLLRASVRRPAICIRPRSRQSSVIAVNWTPRTPPSWRWPVDGAPAAGATPPEWVIPGDAGAVVESTAPDGAFPGVAGVVDAPAGAAAGLRRFRKPNGTRSLLLGRAGVRPDRLDHVLVGKRGGVAQRPPLRDVAQEAAHDLA